MRSVYRLPLGQIATAAALPLLFACDPHTAAPPQAAQAPQPPQLDDATAASLIKQAYQADHCAQYFTVGQPVVKDKLLNAPPAGVLGVPQGASGTSNDVLVDAVIPVAKTSVYVSAIEGATIMTLASTPCTDDFVSPMARFGTLDAAFRKVPVGTPVNLGDRFRFQLWQSGWRIVGRQ